MKRIFSHRGFSLIETIAILVVIGVIIGGIWMVYSSVNRQRQLAVQERQISDLLSATRDYLRQYNEGTAPVYHPITNPTEKDITQLLIDRSLLPASVRASTAGANVETEYALAKISTFNSSGNPYNTGPLIKIGMTGLNVRNCRLIVNDWAGSAERIQSSGMVAVVINATSVNQTNIDANNKFSSLEDDEFALKPETIQASCNGDTNDVALIFRLVK